MARILLLHTGGTLGMTPHGTPSALAPGAYLDHVLEQVPELRDLADLEERELRTTASWSLVANPHAEWVDSAIAYLEAIGMERKAARLRYLFHRWARRLESHPRVRIHTSFDPRQSCGLTLFQVDGVDSGRLSGYLMENYRIITTAIKHPEFEGVRVTPNVYTTLREIDLFAEAVERFLAKEA